MPAKESLMSDLDLDSLPDPADKDKPPGYEVEGDETSAEGSGGDVEVVDDTPASDRGRKPLEENPDEIPEDELAEYSSKVKERIGKLRHGYHDERRAKERETREKEEAIRFARAVADENQRLKQMYSAGEKVFGETLVTAAQAQLDAAKRKVKDAYEAGDADALVAAQEELAEAKYRTEQAKSQRLQQPPLQERSSDVESAQHTQQPRFQPQQPDQLATKWQQKNPWFGSDDEMTSLALGVHKKLVESGVDPRTPEYYERIDARVKQIFPDYFGVDSSERQATQKRPASVVAPQTRNSAPKKIVLNKSQVAIAKRLNIPVEEYARQVALLERNSNG